jgi:hypothetical protein
MSRSASQDYFGRRVWAEAWARRLQCRVGTIIDGRRIVAVKARRYGESALWRWSPWWSVAEEWIYDGQPGLGTFGGDTALSLSASMP